MTEPVPPNGGDSDNDPLLGRVLDGRFKVLSRIGAGGMGRVYKATQSPLGRTVALKVVIPTYGDGKDPNFYKRFFLEASVTSKLSHPNTITIFDYGKTEDGLVYIAMEYLQGRTLHETVVTEGALPAPKAVHIASQVARSLVEAHELGVVHRDLKPANVMLVRHGEDDAFVKVLDFGLVKFFGAQAAQSPEAEELTQEGIFVGSPQYMAPEQAGEGAEPRSDIYSLGVVLYLMLAGKTPFRGRTPAETILMHVREPLPPLPPGIPPDVAGIVYKALEKNPAHRFQTMQELLSALKRSTVGEKSSSQYHADEFQRLARAFTPSGGHPISPPPLPGVARPLAEQVVESGTLPIEVVKPIPKRLLVGVGVGALVVWGVVAAVWFATRAPTKQPEPVAVSQPAPAKTPEPAPKTVETPKQAEPAEPEPVRAVFRVVSEPAGASVYESGELVGKAPLDLVRTVSDGQANVKLTFKLDGYEPASLEGQSGGEEVPLKAKLRKLAPKKAATPKAGDPGYKEDPY